MTPLSEKLPQFFSERTEDDANLSPVSNQASWPLERVASLTKIRPENELFFSAISPILERRRWN